MTELIRGLHNLKPKHLHSVLTIGNFDGVHLGHQKLLNAVQESAKRHQAPSMIMTFEPHPLEFFLPAKPLARITRFREKYLALAKLNLDYVLVLPFNQRLASLSASDFATVVAEKIKPLEIIVGNDFRFGHKRQGDLELLQTSVEPYGINVKIFETVALQDGRVSSTALRDALSQGDLQRAEQLLGHPYTMTGRVRAGEKRGRQLGFPTANIHLHRRSTPLAGVFTVMVHGLNHEPHPGVANIGTRPTVDGTQTILEVHLLNFNKNIYGRYVTVEFCTKLRDEIRFSSIDLLQKQIANDVAAAENYFRKQGVS